MTAWHSKQACESLVIYDKTSRIVQFTHYTVQGFIHDDFKGSLPSVEYLAKTCLAYLSLDVFREGPCEDKVALEQRSQSYEASCYAAQFWGVHAREAENCPIVQEAVLVLLADANKRNSMLQMEAYARGNITFTGGQTLLHVIAKNGLATICRFILDERNKGELQTPRLSETDTDVAARDNWGRTPLSYAAGNGHREVVKLLLEKGAEVDTKDIEGMTPMSHALWDGNPEVVKLLLEKGAEVDAESKYSRQTPMGWAAHNGHSEVVKLLLKKGAKVNAKDIDGKTVLDQAKEQGYWSWQEREQRREGKRVVVELLEKWKQGRS